MISSDSTEHGHQHNLYYCTGCGFHHSPHRSTGPGHSHGLRRQCRPLTPICLPLSGPMATDISMASGGSSDHRHPHGLWTQDRDVNTDLNCNKTMDPGMVLSSAWTKISTWLQVTVRATQIIMTPWWLQGPWTSTWIWVRLWVLLRNFDL